MSDRFTRVLLVVLVALIGLYVAEPFVDRLLFTSGEPRVITPRGELAPAEQTTVTLFQTVAPSVVQVVAGSRGGQGGTGTGFIWDKAGHLVTNNHVVQGANRISVRMASGDVYRAELVGRAPNYDLAVLRVSAGSRLPPPIAIGDSDDLKVGQWAFAIGNPFGLDQTLTTGIISALNRRLPTAEGRELADVIQTDAAINPGNSGGPLLDSAGRLIGVNTAIFSPSGTNAGIGFAIPSKVVNRIVPELIAKGRVPTPGIGIVAGDEDIATRTGVHGLIVGEVVPGSPAARAGLKGIDEEAGQLGDVIVGVNDRTVARLSDFTDALEKTKIGDTVSLKVQRHSGTVDVAVQVIDIGEKSSGD
jgi:2-alkenal reductase